MRCHRCGEPLHPGQRTDASFEGRRPVVTHAICPRSPVEVLRMKEDKMMIEERKARGAA